MASGRRGARTHVSYSDACRKRRNSSLQNSLSERVWQWREIGVILYATLHEKDLPYQPLRPRVGLPELPENSLPGLQAAR
jgi:hypothetical protein